MSAIISKIKKEINKVKAASAASKILAEEKKYIIEVKNRVDDVIICEFRFKGTFFQMKDKVQKTLDEQNGVGLKVISITDEQVIYCAYN